MKFEPLRSFRQEVHRLLTKAKDATFELMDAVMTHWCQLNESGDELRLF
jgi:hypothetical protein